MVVFLTFHFLVNMKHHFGFLRPIIVGIVELLVMEHSRTPPLHSPTLPRFTCSVFIYNISTCSTFTCCLFCRQQESLLSLRRCSGNQCKLFASVNLFQWVIRFSLFSFLFASKWQGG